MSSGLLGGVVGVLAGALAGLFGIGGGAVMIPLLGLLLGISQRQAQGMTLAVMLLPLGLPALWTYLQRGVRIQWELVAWLVLGFLPGAWAGARGAHLVPDLALRLAFSFFLVFVAIRLWRKQNAVPVSSPMAVSPSKGAAVGLIGGLASGLLGIGGGLIVIPLLMGLFGKTQLEAQATSLAVMILPIGLPAVWVYASSGEGLPWIILAGVTAGFAVGSFLGARVATRIQPERLRKAFALFLVTMAAGLALRIR